MTVVLVPCYMEPEEDKLIHLYNKAEIILSWPNIRTYQNFCVAHLLLLIMFYRINITNKLTIKK